MNIILGEEAARPLMERYTVLPLDTFQITGQEAATQSYCVIEALPVQDLRQIDQWRDLHEKLMINYARRNWNYCEQAIQHLMGRWNGELDTFYLELSGRIEKFKQQDPGPDWSPVIAR
jgi:hypothetical protein